MFVDASALCAVLLGEEDGLAYAERIRAAPRRMTSPVAVFEVTLAVARMMAGDVATARRDVEAFLALADVEMVAIESAELARALDAFDRFGKGQHPARLNMGDCFSYACAKTHGAALLFKGDDFGRTDIAIA